MPYRVLMLLFVVTVFGLAVSLVGFDFAPGGDMFPSRVRPESSELRRVFERSGLGPIATAVPSEVYRRFLGADEILYFRIVGSVEFEIYVARWSGGNPFAFEVFKHAPDICWSRTGWICERARSGVDIHPAVVPGEWRLFSGSSHIQEVAFWSVFDGEVSSLGYTRPRQSPAPRSGWDIFSGSEFLKAWRQSVETGKLNFHETTAATVPIGKRDSYFVRVNSDRSLDVISSSKEFTQLDELFKHVGLFKLVP